MSYSAFDPMEFAQANPFATLETFPQFFNQLSQNQIAAAQAQYAQQQQQAALNQTQAQTGYINQGLLPNAQANAANTQAQTALLQGMTPADIAKANAIANTAQFQAANPAAFMGGPGGAIASTELATGVGGPGLGVNYPNNGLWNPTAGGPPVNANGMVAPGSRSAPPLLPPSSSLNQPNGSYNIPADIANPNLQNSGLTMTPQQAAALSQMAPNIPSNQNYLGLAAGDPNAIKSLIYAKALGLPQYQAAVKGQVATATTQADQYQEYLKQANQDALNANNLINNAEEFKNNYQNAIFKGPRLGQLPSKGFETFLAPTHDFTAEQNVDTAASNIQAAWARLNFPSRITNVDLGLANTAKPSRMSEPQAAMQNINYIQQNAYRVKEEPNFAAYVGSAYGIQNAPQVAQLWNNYMSDKPVYNWDKHEAVPANFYSYPQYLNKILGAPKNSPAPGSLGPQNPQAISGGQNTSQNAGSLPTPPSNLNSAADYQKWVLSLSPAQQAAEYNRLKGGG